MKVRITDARKHARKEANRIKESVILVQVGDTYKVWPWSKLVRRIALVHWPAEVKLIENFDPEP